MANRQKRQPQNPRDDLQDFLKNNPKCAEPLARVVKNPKDWSFVSIPDHPEVLNKTLSELGDVGDTKLGTLIGQAGDVAAQTLNAARAVYFTADYYKMSGADRGEVAFHELAFHGSGLDHVDAAHFFNLTGWEPPRPPVEVSPYASSSVRLAAERGRDIRYRNSRELQGAAFTALHNWVANGCK